MSLAPRRQTTNLRSLVTRTAWQLDDIAYSRVSVYHEINQRVVHLLQLRRCTRTTITSIDATFTKTVVIATSGDTREHRLGHVTLIMVALRNRADHYIFILWFLLSFFFFMVALCNRADHYIFILFLSSSSFFFFFFFLA